jgi:hypothetical protein
VLRRVFGPKMDDDINRVIKSKRMRLAGHVACVGEIGKPEGKRPLTIPRHTWEDNIRVDLREIGWKVVT